SPAKAQRRKEKEQRRNGTAQRRNGTAQNANAQRIFSVILITRCAPPCLVFLFVFLCAFAPLRETFFSSAQTQSLPPYKNPNLPIEQRVNDLVSRMTLEEKVAQMGNAAPAIERLGVPAHDYWNEALHGVARSGIATVFPQAIGLAATWDTKL